MIRNLRITVDGRVYDVVVEEFDVPAGTPAPRPVAPVAAVPVSAPVAAAPVAVAAPRPAAAAGDITSPLAGKIVSIDVAVGQPVAAGAKVAVLEAMKMHTTIYATDAGTVSAVLAQPGDTVEEGRPLIRLG